MAVAPLIRPISAYNIANRVMVRVRSSDLSQANRYATPVLNNAASIMRRTEKVSDRGPTYSTVDFGALSKNLSLVRTPVDLSCIRGRIETPEIDNRSDNISAKPAVSLHEILVGSGKLMEAVGMDGIRTYAKPDGALVGQSDIYSAITPFGYARLLQSDNGDADGIMTKSDFKSILGTFDACKTRCFIKNALEKPAVGYVMKTRFGDYFLSAISKTWFSNLGAADKMRLIAVSAKVDHAYAQKFMGWLSAENVGDMIDEFDKTAHPFERKYFKDPISLYRLAPYSMRREMAQGNFLFVRLFEKMTDEEAITHLSFLIEADGYYRDTFRKRDEILFDNLFYAQQRRFVELMPDYQRAEYYETLLCEED